MTQHVDNLDCIFNPRSIAVAGVSEERGNLGRDFLAALVDFSFAGALYAINPKGGQILGNKIYGSLLEVPGPVDYVIGCIPAKLTENLLELCVQKRVKVLHLFTAGFGELDSRGAEIEAKLAKIAHQGGVRIIGPNGMGIYHPAGGISFSSNLPKEAGNIAFISQSGGNAFQAIRLGNNRSLYFSKVISYGNALDLNETDFFEYCAKDPKTTIIAAYIEGVRDGQAFIKALVQATQNKPVVLVKGGRGKAGARAIASHTGSLAGNEVVWEAVFKQTRAIRADTIEDMIETICVLQYYPKTVGGRVCIVGFSGGVGVLATDACETAGLSLPVLDTSVQEELKTFAFFSNAAGSIYSNPVDTPLVVMDRSALLRILNIVARAENIDWIFAHLRLGVGSDDFSREASLKQLAETFIEFGQAGVKSVVLVIDPTATEAYPKTVAEIREDAFQAGILVSSSFTSAAKAVASVVEYRATVLRLRNSLKSVDE
jgi:acyl-CoA synthetase (NDP forming)